MKQSHIVNHNGYTLLESLVALAIFLAVIIPLLQAMTFASKINRGKEYITAASLLEQESALLIAFPDQLFISKKRTVNDKEWFISLKTEGHRLKKCFIQANSGKRKVTEMVFYIFNPGIE